MLATWYFRHLGKKLKSPWVSRLLASVMEGVQMWVSTQWVMLPVAGITCGQGTGKQEEDVSRTCHLGARSSCQAVPKSK